MFGPRYFGPRYFGPRYFGPIVASYPDSTADNHYDFEVDNTNIDSDQTDFPARCDLAKLPTAVREWLNTELDANGDGIRVTDSSDVVLSYSLLNFAKAGGVVTGQLNFKCSPTSASALQLRLFASATADNAEDEAGTYSGTSNAYNFEQDPSTTNLLDLTSANLDLPSVGTMTSGDLIPGLYGNCWDFDGSNDGAYDGTSNWPSTTISEWSFIVWVYANSGTTDDVFLSNDGSGYDQSFQIGFQPEALGPGGTGDFQINFQSDSARYHSWHNTSPLGHAAWYQVAIHVSSDQYMHLIVDGVEADSDILNDATSGSDLTPGPFAIGIKQTIRAWAGRINAVHMFESDIGFDWIKFDYYNMTESDNELQNWSYVTPGVVSPSAIASAEAFGLHTITGGADTSSPSLLIPSCQAIDMLSPVNPHYPLNQGLQAYWRCLPGTKQRHTWFNLCRNQIPDGEQAATGSDLPFPTDSLPRQGGYFARDFGPASAGYYRTADCNMNVVNEISLSFWMYLRGKGSVKEVFIKYQGASKTGVCTIVCQAGNTSGFRGIYRINGAYATTGYVTQTLDKWQHWTHTYRNGHLHALYLDGKQVWSEVRSGIVNGGTVATAIDIGGRPSYNYHIDAALDDIRLWNRYLPPEEALQLYRDSMRSDDPSLNYLSNPVAAIATAGGGGSTVTPTGVTSGEAVGSHVLAPGSVTVVTTAIASSEAIGDPIVVPGSVDIVATAITSAEAVGSHTLVPGSFTVVSNAISSAEAIGAHTLAPGSVTVVSNAIASGEAVGSHTLVPGSFTVVISAIDSVEAVGSHTLLPGLVTVINTAIESSEVIGSHILTTTVAVAASSIVSAEAFGSHQLAITVSPAAITTDEVVGSHTLTTGSVTVNASSISPSEAVGSHTLTTGAVTVTATAITSDEAVGSHTLTTGSVTVQTTSVATAEAVGSHTLTTGSVTVAASAILSGESIGSHVITTGPVTVGPSSISSGESSGSHTITTGVVTVVSSSIASGEVIGSHTLVQPQVVTATGVMSAESLGSHTLLAGSIAVTPSSIASTEAVGSLEVIAGSTSVNVDSIDSVEVFGTVVLVPGPVTVSPTGTVSSEIVPNPIITSSVNVLLSAVTSAESFGAAEVLPGSVVVNPSGITPEESIGSHVVVPGSFTVVCTGITSAESVTNPVLTTFVNVNPTGIESEEAFGTPYISFIIYPTSVVSSEGFGTDSAILRDEEVGIWMTDLWGQQVYIGFFY